MLGWRCVCAIALLVATPAMAGERADYKPTIDTLGLLMRDQRATFATPASQPIRIVDDMYALQMRDDRTVFAGTLSRPILAAPELYGFRIGFPEQAVLPNGQRRWTGAPSVAMSTSISLYRTVPSIVPTRWIPLWAPDQVTSFNGGRYAVIEAMALGHRSFMRTPLEAMVMVQFNDRQIDPTVSLAGGVAGVAWSMLPREGD